MQSCTEVSLVKHIYDNFYLEIHAVMDNPFRISGCNRYPFRGKRRHRCLPVIFHECLCEIKRCAFLFFAGEVFRKTMSTSLRKSQTEASLTTSVLTCCSRTVSILIETDFKGFSSYSVRSHCACSLCPLSRLQASPCGCWQLCCASFVQGQAASCLAPEE